MKKLYFNKKLIGLLGVGAVGVYGVSALNQPRKFAEKPSTPLPKINQEPRGYEGSTSYPFFQPRFQQRTWDFSSWIKTFGGRQSLKKWISENYKIDKKLKDLFKKSKEFTDSFKEFTKKETVKSKWLDSKHVTKYFNDWKWTTEGRKWNSINKYIESDEFKTNSKMYEQEIGNTTKKSWLETKEGLEHLKQWIMTFKPTHTLWGDWKKDTTNLGYNKSFAFWKNNRPQTINEWAKSNFARKYILKYMSDEKNQKQLKLDWEKTHHYFTHINNWLETNSRVREITQKEWAKSKYVLKYYREWIVNEGKALLKAKWDKLSDADKEPKNTPLFTLPFSKTQKAEWYFSQNKRAHFENFKEYLKKQLQIKPDAPEQIFELIFREMFKESAIYKKGLAADRNYETSEKYYLEIAKWVWDKWKSNNPLIIRAFNENKDIKKQWSFHMWSWLINNGIKEYQASKEYNRDFKSWRNDHMDYKKKYDSKDYKTDFENWKKSQEGINYYLSLDISKTDYSLWKSLAVDKTQQTYDLSDQVKQDFYKWGLQEKKVKDAYYADPKSESDYRKWRINNKRSIELEWVNSYKYSNQINEDFNKWLLAKYDADKVKSNQDFTTHKNKTLDEKLYFNEDYNNFFTSAFTKFLINNQLELEKDLNKIYSNEQHSKDELKEYNYNNLSPKDKEVTIFHTNDFHSSVSESYWGGMGYPKVKAIVDKERQRYEKSGKKGVFLVDGGDFLGGSLFATLTKGEGTIEVLNEMGYDAMVIGNHEFDFGAKTLKDIITKTKIPFLSANINQLSWKPKKLTKNPNYPENLNPNNPFKEFKIITKNGVKIGMFGLTTPASKIVAHPNKVQDYEFTDTIIAAKEMVKELKKQKVDVIMALGHMGDDKNSTDGKGKISDNSRSSYIISKVPEIDIWIDGHTHQVASKVITLDKEVDSADGKEKIKKGKQTLLVQSGGKGAYLGKINLKLDKDNKITFEHKNIHKSKTKYVRKDGHILDVIRDINVNKIEPQKNVKIGFTNPKELDRKGHGTKEYALGNLIAKSMLDESKADIALTNTGGIRASLPAKELTVGDILNILPFGNTVVSLKLSINELKQGLEMALSNYPNYKGAFPQIAGMKVEFYSSSKEIVDPKTKKTRIQTFAKVTKITLNKSGEKFEWIISNADITKLKNKLKELADKKAELKTEKNDANKKTLTTAINTLEKEISDIKKKQTTAEAKEFNKEVTLATNDFVGSGGDGYSMFKPKVKTEYETLDKALINKLKKDGLTGSAVDGRTKQNVDFTKYINDIKDLGL